MNIHGYKNKLKSMRRDIQKCNLDLKKEYKKRGKDWKEIEYLENKIKHVSRRMEYYRFLVKQLRIKKKNGR